MAVLQARVKNTVAVRDVSDPLEFAEMEKADLLLGVGVREPVEQPAVDDVPEDGDWSRHRIASINQPPMSMDTNACGRVPHTTCGGCALQSWENHEKWSKTMSKLTYQYFFGFDLLRDESRRPRVFLPSIFGTSYIQPDLSSMS